MENGRKRRVVLQTKVDQNGGWILVTFTMNGKKCYREHIKILKLKKLFKSTHFWYKTKCLLSPKFEFDVKNASFGHFYHVR